MNDRDRAIVRATLNVALNLVFRTDHQRQVVELDGQSLLRSPRVSDTAAAQVASMIDQLDREGRLESVTRETWEDRASHLTENTDVPR